MITVFLSVLLLSSPLMAARSADPIVKEFSLSKSCAENLMKFLDINLESDILSVQIPVPGLVETADGQRKLQTVKNSMEVGRERLIIRGHWRDNSGAVPRRDEWPRYWFTSPEKNSLEEFEGFWKSVASKMAHGLPRVTENNDWAMHDERICEGDENLWLSILRRPDYSKEHGEEPLRLSLVLFVGEILPKLVPHPYSR